MSEFKGTPGPWEVVDEHPDRSVLEIHSCDGDTFVSVYTVDKFADHNANLIAAAPELLEALQHIMQMQTRGFIVLGDEATRKSSAAIAKALGQ